MIAVGTDYKLPENCDHEDTEPLPDYVSVDGRRCNDCELYLAPETEDNGGSTDAE